MLELRTTVRSVVRKDFYNSPLHVDIAGSILHEDNHHHDKLHTALQSPAVPAVHVSCIHPSLRAELEFGEVSPRQTRVPSFITLFARERIYKD